MGSINIQDILYGATILSSSSSLLFIIIVIIIYMFRQWKVTEYGQKNRHDVEEKDLKEFLRLQKLASEDDEEQTDGSICWLHVRPIHINLAWFPNFKFKNTWLICYFRVWATENLESRGI